MGSFAWSSIDSRWTRIDSDAIIKSINRNEHVSPNGWRLVQKIRQPLEREWEIKISRSYHKANMRADGLVNLGCCGNVDLIVYDVKGVLALRLVYL